MEREIRRAYLEEISIIRDIADVAFRDAYQDILSTEQIEYMMDWMYSEESLKSQMLQRAAAFYILKVDSRDVGYLSFERHLNPPEELEGQIVFNLQKLYLLPEYRGQHHGEFLLRYAEERMRSFVGGSPACYELNVNRHNSAVSFYEKQGLTINREGDFAIGNGYYMNDYVMRKGL